MLTWKRFFEDEFVTEEEWEVGWEGLGPHVEPQEADGQVHWALAREPDARAGDGVHLDLQLQPHGFGHLGDPSRR